MKINEVDPRNYDSDIDYYNALRAKPKRAQEPDDLPEPSRPYTDKDAEDDISQQRQRADAKFRQKRKVEYVDQEGSAPNGKKHNKLYVIDAQDEATARHEEYLFDKHEWGAKKVVDTKLEKNTDGTVRLTLYIVDNHKYGFWRPWKDSPVYKEGTELDEKAPPGMEDWINSRKADFKKRYGDKWQQVLYATAWKRHNNESVGEGLKEFAPAGGGGNIPRGPKTPSRGPWDDSGEDPYQLRRYNRSADFFDQFDSDGVDKQKFDKKTGEYEGYYFDRDAASGITQIAYFKFDDPTKIGDNDPGVGWYYEPIDEGVAEGEDIDARISNLKDAIRFETPRSVPGEDHREQYARHAEKIAGYKAELKKLVAQKKQQGVAEGSGNIGRQIKALYQKIYDQGDDSIDYMYHESPVFAQISDEYEGDLDSIIAEVDPSELQVIANELEAYLQGPGLTEATNPEDVICLDVPLFIRLMEYAREDASTDMDLHDVAENAVKLSAGGTTLSMKNYESIIPSDAVEDETIKEAGMDLEQGRKNIISILKAGEQGQDAEIMVGGEPITLEYPEARFVGGRYKAFLKAGRQEEFLRALTNPQAFDRIMAKLRTMIDKQKNFRGSVPGERGVEEGSFHNPGQQDSPVAGAITRRILMQRTDLLAKHGPVKVGQAIDSVADFVGDVDEIGSSDVSGWVKQVERELGGVAETQVNEAGDVKGAVLDCFKQILAGAQAGDDMIDYLADELNDYFKPVRASRDPQLQKAYQHMMDNGQEAEGDPQAMAQVAQQAISMLSSVPEAAPGLVKAAAGLAVGGIAAAGAPAIVGILGPLLGIPMAAYGAYSAAKLGMQGVEKLWDMAAEKLGGDDKVAQYTNAKIAELPPEQKQAAAKVVKAVSESRQRKNPALAENQYWCNLDKQVKPIPEGYRKNKDGYLVRK